MRYPLSFVLFCLITAAPAAFAQYANEIQNDVASFCADKWGDEYEMQIYCRENQAEAAMAVNAILDRYDKGAEEWNIVKRCHTKWTDEKDRPDWEMVEYCTNNQIEAYKKLHPSAD